MDYRVSATHQGRKQFKEAKSTGMTPPLVWATKEEAEHEANVATFVDWVNACFASGRGGSTSKAIDFDFHFIRDA